PAATAAGLKPAQPIPAPAAKAPAAKTIPPAAAPVAKATPAPATGGGAASVQIGAFSSQAQVESGWADAARIAPGAIAGKSRRVEPIQRGGQTLYRTSVAGFASRADAQAFCGQLKAAGKSCFVK
ncbi:MAG: SPOR domain-containing protein, partial [Phenylobacterium sp.]|uniref:SPOR domain-containing protein n=1 Tax=Phenylobacterium sp. TaxID=1871053 RepID=UPI00273346E7